MKKFVKLLLVPIFVLAALLPLAACNSRGAQTYDVHDYFEVEDGYGYTLDDFLSSEIPSTHQSLYFITAKEAVKIKQITGTAYYNYEWYSNKKWIDDWAQFPTSTFTTTGFVENVEITKGEPTHFNFVITPESSTGLDEQDQIPARLKAGTEIMIGTISKKIPICLLVRNLKIEFEPA